MRGLELGSYGRGYCLSDSSGTSQIPRRISPILPGKFLKLPELDAGDSSLLGASLVHVRSSTAAATTIKVLNIYLGL